MTDQLPFSHPVVVAHLPDGGSTFRLAPSEAERAALAKDFGIVGIPEFKATVTVVPESRGGVRVEGQVDAVVRQTCVVTLEAFDAPVSEEIEVHFVPEDKLPEVRPGQEIEVAEDDGPDPLVNGIVDIGAVAAEFLALGLDPYPRKPGVAFEPPAKAADDNDSPFGVLGRLRSHGSRDDE